MLQGNSMVRAPDPKPPHGKNWADYIHETFAKTEPKWWVIYDMY